MKRTLTVLALLIIVSASVQAQITTPVIRANFGVDGDLRANFFNSFLNNGNDDWFRNNAGTGDFIIDTTGASYILSRYAADPNFRRVPFFRGMRHPQFSIVNGKMLIDGIFIRDYHGDDSTVFASGSNKNGDSPAAWQCPVSQGIPDKNDILDMMMHVRRDGEEVSNDLWLFGGVSIENTTGSRYFDFEMYQTDIFYDRTQRRFFGYGPDAGHTTWQFDGAGNVLSAGDVIFTAEFGTSGINLLEARIWVHSSALLVTPTAFNWGGAFDGASNGSSYGYANILPKTAGDFYIGLQSSNNTWAGAFNVVRQDNSVVPNYVARQYMEFAVNLSKLGLDPLITIGDPCGMPFRRIMVKTRASASFTAELKDFVGPFDFFRAPRAEASADVPLYCGTSGVSNISVNNPLLTSLYTWYTPDGNIVGDTVGPSITVNAPGVYIVTQQLMDSCGTSYARDTVTIVLDSNCAILKTNLRDFRAGLNGWLSQVSWSVTNQESASYYEIERSIDGVTFGSVRRIYQGLSPSFNYADDISKLAAEIVYYRLKIVDANGNTQYSKIIALSTNGTVKNGVKILPNPVRNQAQLLITSAQSMPASLSIHNLSGARLRNTDLYLQKGAAVIELDNISNWPRGVYIVKLNMGNTVFTEKMILIR
ncbi:MAG TPA: T9SS type A sorting domain-containing protein [Chitinophagaceae bacterium]|nr:T9SS type A sorting domain-containing protein [Chitinophagaceae bacterium]